MYLLHIHLSLKSTYINICVCTLGRRGNFSTRPSTGFAKQFLENSGTSVCFEIVTLLGSSED